MLPEISKEERPRIFSLLLSPLVTIRNAAYLNGEYFLAPARTEILPLVPLYFEVILAADVNSQIIHGYSIVGFPFQYW
jgi:hypothetical protein